MEGTGDRSEGDIQSSLSTLISGGTLVSAGKFVALICGFLTQVVMARILTQSAYGEVVLSLTVLNFISIVTKLGLDDGVIHKFSQFERNPDKLHGIVRSVLVLSVVSGLIGGISVYLAAPFIARNVFENPSLTYLLRVVSVAVPFTTIRAVSVALARSAQDARTHTYVDQLAQPIARFVLVASLVLGGFGAIGATIAEVVAYVLAGVLAFILARRVLPEFEHSAVPMYRSVLSFSLPLIVVQGVNTIVSQVDIYMLGYFWNSATVGGYNVILQLSNLFYPVLMSLGFLLPPILARLNTEGEYEEMRQIYQILTKWVVIVLLPLLILLVFAPELVIGFLFGNKYTDAVMALQILAVGNFFSISMGLVNSSLVGLGKNEVTAYLVGFQFVVNALLDYVLVPEFAATGAALATAVALVANNTAGVAVLNYQFGVHPVTWSWFTPIAAVTGVATLAYGVVQAVSIPTYTVIPVVGVVYPVFIAKFAIEPADEELLILVEERTNHDLDVVRRIVRTLN